MRALRFHGTSLNLVTDASEPKPAPGEVLIKPTRLALSRDDLRLDQRAAAGFTGTIGHLFVGTIVEANVPRDGAPPAATDPRRRTKGRRVVGAMNLFCGKCDLCRGGLSGHCRARQVVGSLGRDGCMADLIALPAPYVFPVPDGVDDDDALFADTLASAAHAAHMLRVEGKPYITVLGDGPLGLLTSQVMARLNASVRLLGKHPEKFTLCDRWAIKHRHISDVGRRADQDVVVDCTGSPSGLELAMRLVRPRGKIILKSARSRLPVADVASTAELRSPDLTPLVVNEIEVLGCRCGSIESALGMLERREASTAGLITGRFRLDQWQQAADAVGRPGSIRVALDP